MWKEVTTRSPTATRSTSLPTVSTIPTASWPITPPGSTGTFPRTMCRSEPQMAAHVTRTTASPGSTISGSGTSASSTRPSPA